jgi:hypothetical protein
MLTLKHERSPVMRKLLSLMVLGAFMMAVSPCWGEIPHLINYQGMLTDTGGNPLTDTLNITFRIYDQSSSGSMLWDETQNDVEIISGLFNVILGSVDPVELPFDEDYWLEIDLGPGEILTPRIQLTSMGYAYRAKWADTSDYSFQAQKADTADYATLAVAAVSDSDWTISGADMYSAVSGNVGIGTKSPSAKLHVEGDPSGAGLRAVSYDGSTGLPSSAGVAALNYASSGSGGPGLYANSNNFHAILGINNNGNAAIIGRNDGIGAGIKGQNQGTGPAITGYAASGDLLKLYRTVGLINLRFSVDNDGDVYTKGNVGIGNTDPGYELSIYKNTNGFVGIEIENPNTGSGSSEGIYFKNEDGSVAGIRLYDEGSSYPQRMRISNSRPNGSIYFATAGYDRMVIANNGMVGIGDFDPSYRLELPNSANAWGRARANDWIKYSSREWKKDISALNPEDYASILKQILEMDMVYYRYKNQEDDRLYLGVIAEDAPEQVVTSDRKSVSLTQFAAFALAGLRAQQAEIEQLKKEIHILRQEDKK